MLPREGGEVRPVEAGDVRTADVSGDAWAALEGAGALTVPGVGVSRDDVPSVGVSPLALGEGADALAAAVLLVPGCPVVSGL